MGFFSKAKDNFENRQKINDYNYRAKEYIQSGKEAYEKAYDDLIYACSKVQDKIRAFYSYKGEVAREINRTLENIGTKGNVKVSTNMPTFDYEASRVSVESWEKLTLVDKFLDTWTVPSLMDFVRDVDSSDVFEAKMNMNNAKHYRDMMRMKKEQLRDAKYAVNELPGFMSDEKGKIEALMRKFKKAAALVKTEQDTEQIEALKQISQLLADSLATEFIDNNYQVTSQYQTIHNRMAELNSSLDNVSWLIEG